jgi:hypothetical protein
MKAPISDLMVGADNKIFQILDTNIRLGLTMFDFFSLMQY